MCYILYHDMLNQIKLSLLVFPALLLAQGQPQFEVASVKPFVPGPPTAGGRDGGGGGCTPFKMDRGRVDICARLATVIGYAYRLPLYRIVGPNWLNDRRSGAFAIAAKLPEGSPVNQVPEMLQSLLADRFQLVVHRASREEFVTALVIAKGGLKLKEAATVDDDPGAIDNPGIGPVQKTESADHTYRWQAPSITLDGLADLCSVAGFIPAIVNMTGVQGRYRVDLTVSLKRAFVAAAAASEIHDNPGAGDSARADMQDALVSAFNAGLEKLGLQLERRKGIVETLVVDHVEKTPAGN
jgi:uncharacterized protein (TIGR03435 family)